MEYSKSLVLLCMLYFLIINGIESISIQIYPHKEGITESSDIQLICNYTVEGTDLVKGSSILAKINNTFVTIAAFEKDSNADHPQFTSNGTYLSSRANLANPTPSFPHTVILTFLPIQCEDEKEYMCSVTERIDGIYYTSNSNSISIVVKGQPAKPDNVPTWIQNGGIEEGTDVTFTCTGKLGNPAGTFVWTKIRGMKSDTHHCINTTKEEMPDSCTFNGTSKWTTKLEAEDNNAIIKCQVEQEFATPDMYQQSQPEDLVVYYTVRNIGITKSPNLTNYDEGATSITLECSAEGNPPPNFTWYKYPDMDTTLKTGKTFHLSKNDVIVKNTGKYVCVGYNEFNELKIDEHIQIDYTTTPAPTTTPSTPATVPTATKDPQTNNEEPSLSTGGVVGIVVGLLCAIAEPPENPRNNLSYIEKQDALGDKNGPFNNHIHYADVSFEDRPRSRKPLQLSQDADLNQTPYAVVMKH